MPISFVGCGIKCEKTIVHPTVLFGTFFPIPLDPLYSFVPLHFFAMYTTNNMANISNITPYTKHLPFLDDVLLSQTSFF